MSKVTESILSIRLMDDLARGETPVHRIHPLAKVLTTIIYLAAVASFGRYEISGLLPFVFYPVLVMSLAELPAGALLKKLLLVEPLIIGIGILNPLLDQQAVVVGGLALSRGWVTFLSIFIKGGLTVVAGLLLIATTGMDRLAGALRMMRVPKVFVLQLLLTYRYIAVLSEELAKMLRAYSLRAPGQKGVKFDCLGPFAGQLLLRTFDRAQRVYQSMALRGFCGEYNTGATEKVKLKDIAYLAGWAAFFAAARLYDLPALAGAFLTGVTR